MKFIVVNGNMGEIQHLCKIRDYVRNILKAGPARKIATNSGWLFLDAVFRYAGGFFISIWLARYFGPDRFGTYNFATAFTVLFGALAGLGLKSIVIRELVHRSDQKDELLGSAFRLMMISGVLVWAMSGLGIWLLRPNDTLTNTLVMIIGTGFVFQSFQTMRYYFESRTESKFVIIGTNIAFVVSNTLKVLLIVFEKGLVSLAVISVLDTAIAGISLLYLGRRQGVRFRTWKWDAAIAKSLLKASAPLIFAGLFATIFLKIDQVMIGEILDEKEVGLYAISVKLTELWYIIPTIIQTSVFPNLMKKDTPREVLFDKMHRLFSLLMLFSVCVAIPLSLGSKWIVNLLYGEAYNGASSMLAISIWALVFVCFGIARLPYIIASGNIKMSMYFGIIGATINVVLNLFLIPRYGGNGAAIATLISYATSAYLANFAFPSFRVIGKLMTKSLFAPNYRV